MKYYAVIDTNVLVSALLKWDSVPGKILEHTLVGDIIPVLHSDIISEYQEVLKREKFGFDAADVEILLDGLNLRGLFFDAAEITEHIQDRDDAIFYAVTMDAKENGDAYLITGNKKHFPIRPFVVTPREMLDLLEGSDNNGLGDKTHR